MNNSVQYIFLSAIKTSSFNPCKTFNETDLTADSIEAQGFLQPIMVRPKDDIFEIVYGERRYKASLIAGFATIPAIVRELSDNDAIECALTLTENFQRQDVSPVEEASAFQSLIQNNHYDISSLMAKFAKSKSYIRSRLRLCTLIAPFAELLISEEINLVIALELCKYSKEMQEAIFEDHYATDNSYQNWIGKRAKDVVDMVGHNCTTNLNDYLF